MIQWKWYIIILSPLWASTWYGRRERLIQSQNLRPGHTLCLTSLGVREGFIWFSLLLFVQQLLDSTSWWQSHADVKLLHFIWNHFLCSVLWLVKLSLVIFYGLCFLSKLRFLLCFPLTVWTFFVRPVLPSIRRWIIMHDKKNTDKMTPFVHRSSSYHYHMCNGTPVRLASPWRFVWLTLIWHLIMLSVFLMNVRNATLFDQQRQDRPLKSHSPQ